MAQLRHQVNSPSTLHPTPSTPHPLVFSWEWRRSWRATTRRGSQTRTKRWPSFATRSAHRQPCTLHPTPCTLHPAPCTLHPAPCTLHPTSCTRILNPERWKQLGALVERCLSISCGARNRFILKYNSRKKMSSRAT